MAELHGIYQRSFGEKEDFLRRIIPLTLTDAQISTRHDRVEHAKHWEAEFQAMEQCFKHLSNADHRLYKAMQDWHNHVGDMLAYMNDVLRPNGFENILKDDFVALCEMLR